jgi:enoyl-CoA hydratase/carnithine racemase
VSPEGALELGIVTELAQDARARAIEIAEGLLRQSAVSVVAAKRSIVRGANLPIEEGLRIEAEQWLNTIVTEQAMTLMRDYVSQPFDKRREWVRNHGIPPVAGNAIGS